VASENRTVTGISPPWNRTAVLSAAPAALGAKLPSATIPLAWFARTPGWRPNSWFMTSIVCSATELSSAHAVPDARTIVAARQTLLRRMMVPPGASSTG
jgi:hypothetical protein